MAAQDEPEAEPGYDATGERDSAPAIQAAMDTIGPEGACPAAGSIRPGTRMSVHGRPGDHPSRPLTMRARALLPFRARKRAGG